MTGDDEQALAKDIVALATRFGRYGYRRITALTGALLDRLTHHVHILEMNGDSYRLKRSRESAVSQPSDEPHEE